ncbi:Unknown protein, partial [Striga hermonthica]
VPDVVEMVGFTLCNKNFLIAYVIIKDETEYNYDWVIQRLRLLIGPDVHPSATVTDRELGLITAIQRNFPVSPHIRCTWHVNKDVKDR